MNKVNKKGFNDPYCDHWPRREEKPKPIRWHKGYKADLGKYGDRIPRNWLGETRWETAGYFFQALLVTVGFGAFLVGVVLGIKWLLGLFGI